MTPVVSIIIPAFNAEKFIAETIQSVLAQTYSSWELIIVDDGSTDNTANIIKTFFQNDRIRYCYQPNAGVSAARNKGIELSKGEYLAFLDADDLWHNQNIELKISTLKKNSSIGWVFGDMDYIDANNKFICSAEPGNDLNVNETMLIWDGNMVPGICSNIIIRRTCLESGLRFDPSFSTAADIDFLLLLAKNNSGKRVEGVPLLYRKTTNSMSRNVASLEKDYVSLYKKAESNKMFVSDIFRRKCFSNMYLILAGSWWVNANNKGRGLLFILRAILFYPPNILKVLSKFFSK